MKPSDFTITVSTPKTPAEVFSAVNNVCGWWSSRLEGKSGQLHDEFVYRYADMHASTQQLIEVVPDKKVVWRVSNSFLSFTKNKSEWDGTTISFEIGTSKGTTQLVFTHHGLTRASECFEACSGGWNHYIHQSLVPLINTGKGNPD